MGNLDHTRRLRLELKRLGPLHDAMRWLARDLPSRLIKLLIQVLRAVLPASVVWGPPKGAYSVLEMLQSQPSRTQGRIVLADQGAPPLPNPSLMLLSGLNQHAEQPWPILWSRHRQARLVGPGLAHVNEKKLLCAEAVYGASRATGDPAYWYPALGAPCRLEGSWTSLASRWVPVDQPCSYAHWLLEALPRLAVLREFSADTRVVVPPHRLPFQMETLRWLGLESRCRWTTEKSLIVDDYYFSSPPSMIVCYSPYAVDFLRSHFLPLADQSGVTPARIYVHRARRARGAANEKAVLGFFEQHGWSIVDMATLTVARQMELFSHAEAVCGVHGAGFTNAVWCRPGCKIIELCGDHYLSGCFEWLCYCVRAEHRFLVFPTDHALDAEVDLDQLQQLLRSLHLC